MNKQDYRALVAKARQAREKMERAHRRAYAATWALADVLAQFPITNQNYGRGGFSLAQVADDVGLSRAYVGRLRMLADRFPLDKRISGVAPATHYEALRTQGTVAKALNALREADLAGGATTDHFTQRGGLLVRLLRDPERFAEALASVPVAERAVLKEVFDSDPATQPRRRQAPPEGSVAKVIATLRRTRSTLSNLDVSEVGDYSTVESELRTIVGICEHLIAEVEKEATPA